MHDILIRLRGARLTLRFSTAEGLQEQLVLGSADAGLDWDVRRGEHTAIVGRNGAGKSTLLRLLRGELWLDAPRSSKDRQGGTIHWHTAQGAEDAPLAGREMAALVSAAQQEVYVRQAWDMSGEDLLATGFADSPLLYSAPQAAQRKAVREAAQELDITALLPRAVNTLSQGQLRILLLGRALVRRPALLLLDEYLDGLDAAARKTVLTALERVSAHTTVLMTAHREDSIPAWVRRRLHLEGGLLQEKSVAPVSPVPPDPCIPAVVEVAAPSCAAPQEIPLTSTPPLVVLDKATVYIDRTPVLRHICWTWRQGEHWRIHGGNGAGKSTLLRLLAGDEYPALGGSIARHLPRNGGTVTDLESVRRGIRLVSDQLQACYAYDLTGLELVLSGFDNVVGLYRKNTAQEEEEALHWLRFFQVLPLARRRISTLSTGQMRRLLLARALVGGPDILLLDEPCSGLDSATRRQLLELLQAVTAQGVHLALVSHHSSDHCPALNRRARMEAGSFFKKLF